MTFEAFLSFSSILLSFNLPSSTLSPFDGFLLVLYGDLEFFALPSLDLDFLLCAHLVEKENPKSVFFERERQSSLLLWKWKEACWRTQHFPLVECMAVPSILMSSEIQTSTILGVQELHEGSTERRNRHCCIQAL